MSFIDTNIEFASLPSRTYSCSAGLGTHVPLHCACLKLRQQRYNDDLVLQVVLPVFARYGVCFFKMCM